MRKVFENNQKNGNGHGTGKTVPFHGWIPQPGVLRLWHCQRPGAAVQSINI